MLNNTNTPSHEPCDICVMGLCAISASVETKTTTAPQADSEPGDNGNSTASNPSVKSLLETDTLAADSAWVIAPAAMAF